MQFKPRMRVVELPEGQSCTIRELTAAEVLTFADMPAGEANQVLVVYSLCDEAGERLLGGDPAAHLEQLGTWPYSVFSTIVRAALSLNGLDDSPGNSDASRL